MISPRYQVVLDYWFGSPDDKTSYGVKKPFYWTSTPELDDDIKECFYEDYIKAKNGEYDNWFKIGGPYPTLALILLLDQIPRNIFRGSSDAYATDTKALEIAKFAIESGYDLELHLPGEKKFMYMPFLHSEDLQMQKKSVELCSRLEKDFGTDIWAKRYYEIIERFGRFPHRNKFLGRNSTEEELEFIPIYLSW